MGGFLENIDTGELLNKSWPPNFGALLFGLDFAGLSVHNERLFAGGSILANN